MVDPSQLVLELLVLVLLLRVVMVVLLLDLRRSVAVNKGLLLLVLLAADGWRH